jgi:antitoxin component of RelBE/YafQ-DinJ toxin-antitoxin module
MAREKFLHIRLSDSEYAELREQAEKLGLPASQYARMILLRAIAESK